MFRAASCPSSGATTAVAAPGLPIVIRDTVFVNLQLQTDKRYSFCKIKKNAKQYLLSVCNCKFTKQYLL
jgi:hypothetical protein